MAVRRGLLLVHALARWRHVGFLPGNIDAPQEKGTTPLEEKEPQPSKLVVVSSSTEDCEDDNCRDTPPTATDPERRDALPSSLLLLLRTGVRTDDAHAECAERTGTGRQGTPARAARRRRRADRLDRRTSRPDKSGDRIEFP